MTPALFLDRDGVIIRDAGYARDPVGVMLIPGIEELIQRARQAGWKIIVVTNQSGIGRGWIKLHQYKAVSGRMHELLEEQGSPVDAVYFAPFFEGNADPADEFKDPAWVHRGIPETGRWSKLWRKPQPGMLWQAARDWKLDLSRSVMIGDRATDLLVGFMAGVGDFHLVSSDITEAETKEFSVWKQRWPALWEEVKDEGADLGVLKPDPSRLKVRVIDLYAEVQLK